MGTPVLVFGSPCVRFEWCREENNYLTTNKMASNKELGEQWGIHPRDIEKIKFAFEVYAFKGDGKVDGFYIGDLVRACNLNPTMKTIVEIGGEKEKGKKPSSSRICIPSSKRPRTPRTPVASTISLGS